MAIERVGIIGAGTMGAGIATNIAENGIEVSLIDLSKETLNNALERARKFYARNVDRERMSQTAAAAALERLSTGTGLEALENCDLVIEAVFERFDLKAEVYSNIKNLLKDCLLYTSPSPRDS